MRHSLYKKLSTNLPIESSIIQNFYPYTYKSNIIEILNLLKDNNLLKDPRCEDAITILRNKRKLDGLWQADTSYMKSTWIDFDIPKKPGLWITYIINNILNA